MLLMRELLSILPLLLVFVYAPVEGSINIPQEEDRVFLNNGEVVLEFESKDTFRLLGLSGSKGKTWAVKRQQDLVWQIFIVGQNGQPVMVNSQNATYTGAESVEQKDKKSFVFSWLYSLPDGTSGKIFMTVSVSKGSSLSNWDIRSEFPQGWTVNNLTFPIITLEKSANQKMIMPANWGAEYDINAITNDRFLGRYPSSRHTMQLMLLHDDRHTFYFATHDPKANLKEFSARITAKDVEFSKNIVPSEAWNDQGKFSLPWSTAIGLSDKGWEDAVTKWYRPFTFETEWGKRKITEKKHPEWLLNSDLWLVGGHVNDQELARAHKALDYFGVQTAFHWYYWHNSPFDTKYPEYLPAKEGFDRIVREIQEKGSHIVPYVNGRLWDVDTESYQHQGGKEATVLKKDLSPFTEMYASGATNAVICPSSPVWKKVLVDLTDKIQGDVVSTDGVYYDQVASARGLPCFDPSHDHPPGGGSFWVDAYRDIFGEVRTSLKPNSIISVEQNAEPYLDMFDLFLMVNYPQRTDFRPVPLFPIVYSDRALLYGFYIYNHQNLSYRVKNALTLLWGAQLNGGRIEFVQYSAMKGHVAFLKDLVSFRKENHDLFIGGRLMKEITPGGNNPVLTVPNWPARASVDGTSPAVRGAVWQSRTGRYAVVLVNVDEQAHEISLPHLGQPIKIQAGACLRIDVDQSKLNSL